MNGPMVVLHPEAIDQRAKPVGWIRKLWPIARTFALLVVVGRWALAPVIVVAWMSTVLGIAVSWWATVAIGAVVVAGLSRWGWYLQRLWVAADRSRKVLFRAYWPYLCSFCHFVEIGGRRPRTATLASVEFGPGSWFRPDWLRVVVEPCTTHPVSMWDRYESMLRRHLRYRSSTWTTDPGDPNRMVITCQRRPLPTRLDIGPDIPAHDFTPTALDGDGLRPPDRVLLGIGADGGGVWWCPDEAGRAMLFIAGRQGGGKGVIAQRVFYHALATHRVRTVSRWGLRVCDPKAMGEFNWLQRHDVPVAKDPTAMFAMIGAFRVEMERRAAHLDTLGAQNWIDVPTRDLAELGMDGREVLVIDEFVTLLTMKGVVPLRPAPNVEGRPKARPVDPYQVMIGDLQAVFAMGRALGMSLIPMTQHPIAEHMGPFGSTMKANLGARIGVGNLEPEGAGALFGKSHGEEIAHRLRAGIPGRCVHQGLSHATGGDWQEAQIAYSTVAHLEQLLAELGPADPDVDDDHEGVPVEGVGR